MKRVASIAVLLAMTGCSAIQQQKAQPAVTDNLHFKNLRVLPQNITRDELIATMRGYSMALGVRCEHCHMQVQKEDKQEMDFASDARPEKNVARQMMIMTRDINRNYLDRVNAHGGMVTCGTCHRGKSVPEQWTPPPPPAQPAR